MADKKRKAPKAKPKTKTTRAVAKAEAGGRDQAAAVVTSPEVPLTAEAYLHDEGALTVVSVDAVTPEFRLTARRRKAVAEAVAAVSSMLKEGYTLLVADRAGVHARVRAFNAKLRAYLVPGPGGTDLVVPIARARAIALPRQAGG